VHSNTLESPKDVKKQTGKSKTRLLPEAFADRLRRVGRFYPAHRYPEVVLPIDNAPWHAGKVVEEARAANPHRKLTRLPSCSPPLNPIERLWKALRRRATHNRLFDTLADLKKSLRASLSYFQTMRQRVKTLLQSNRKKANRTASPSV
jgi:transposase